MTLKTRDDYLKALKKMRPNIYKFGELIEDVTTHPATKRTVESHCLSFDASHDPELADLYNNFCIYRKKDTSLDINDAKSRRPHY